MEFFLQVAFGLLILFVLYKFNIVKIPARLFFVDRYSSKKLTLKYKRFNGGYHHNFRLKEGKSYVAHYRIVVENGAVMIRLKDVFEKTFDHNETGTFQFRAFSNIQSIFVEGDQTKGSCEVELEEVS